MRILIATFGSLGDLHPYVAIAIELKRRGHRPLIATVDRYQAIVEAEGIDFAVMRPRESQFGSTQEVVRKIVHPRKGPEYLIRQVVMPFVRESYEDLSHAAEGADLLLSHPITFALPLVAEKRGLPWISSVLSPMSFFSAHDPSIVPAAPWLHPIQRFSMGLYRGLLGMAKAMTYSWERPLQELRAEVGLPQTKTLAMFEGQFSPRMNLALFSRLLGESQPDWPANTEICGFARYDGSIPSDAATADLKAFLEAGDPPIVFTLGSSVSMVPKDFFRVAIAAAKELGRRAILITGSPPSADSSRLGSVMEFSYLPYSRVFPHASVNIHPGGIGTLSQALAAGRPMLVTPVAFDQPDNAHRASRLGIARVLPFQRITVKKLTEHLAVLLADREGRDHAVKVGKQIRDENGAQRACDLIEKTASVL